jgi:hypothetical protein
MRAHSNWTWVAVALLGGGLALPGCQEMGDHGATASSEAAPVTEAPVEAGYPPLQSVPPRPQLSYTVQQQREIAQALIADRENARYTSQVVRHRSGLSSLPPPPTPPEPPAPIDVEPTIAARAPEPRLSDQETLVDFLGVLLFGEPIAEPAPERASEPEELSSAPEALPDLPDGDALAPTAAASGPPSDETTHRAPLPPARSAIMARLAAGLDVIDALVDETVPQTPLPPGQSALAARLAVAAQTDEGAPSAPLPAPRPAMVRSADAALPTPPPLKPVGAYAAQTRRETR